MCPKALSGGRAMDQRGETLETVGEGGVRGSEGILDREEAIKETLKD